MDTCSQPIHTRTDTRTDRQTDRCTRVCYQPNTTTHHLNRYHATVTGTHRPTCVGSHTCAVGDNADATANIRLRVLILLLAELPHKKTFIFCLVVRLCGIRKTQKTSFIIKMVTMVTFKILFDYWAEEKANNNTNRGISLGTRRCGDADSTSPQRRTRAHLGCFFFVRVRHNCIAISSYVIEQNNMPSVIRDGK